jgi:hypothetical protein
MKTKETNRFRCKHCGMPLDRDKYVSNDRMTPAFTNYIATSPSGDNMVFGSRYVIDVDLSKMDFSTGCFFCGSVKQ